MAIQTEKSDFSLVPLERLPMDPLISVLVANYNYGRFLPDLVESLLSQTYFNWELIICDDGSTDDSCEVLQRLAAQDQRITTLFKENGGQASAWNLAYAHSRGEIICLLDADDRFRSDKLERVVRSFVDQPRVGFIYHRSQFTDAKGAPVSRPHPESLEDGHLFSEAAQLGGYAFVAKTSEICLRRQIAEKAFPIPVELKGYGDGYISGIVAFVTEIGALEEALTYYRIHGENHSGFGYVDPLYPPTLERWSESHVILSKYQQSFLREEVGDSLADRVRLEDVHIVWRLMGALYILKGKPSQGVEGYSASEILRNLSHSRRKYIWKVLFACPAPVSRWLLRSWWSDRSWKRLIRPLGSLIGLREVASR